MKIYLMLGFSILANLCLTAQVGIGTADPNSSLDIEAINRSSPANTDGILIPRIDEFSVANPTAAQNGMIVFVTGNGTPEKGFYYWDQSSTTWVPFIFPTVKKIDDLEDGRSDSDGFEDGSSIYLGIDSGRADDGNDNQNVGIGFNAFINNTIGQRNVGVGYLALGDNLSGSDNTAVGHKSLEKNNSGINNTAVGRSSLSNNTGGRNNTALGRNAMNANTTGQNNVAAGSFTLVSNTIGINNTAIGRSSMNANTTGSANTAVGYLSLSNNIDGQRNVALGNFSMHDNQSGVQNVAAGNQSLQSLTTGNDNVALGFSASDALQTGTSNISMGTNALRSNISGNENVSLGRSSGLNVTGSNNTLVGFEAGFNTVGSGNIFLGSKAGREETGSNTLYIDNSNVSIPLIGGNLATDKVGINRQISSLSNTFEVGGEASKATAGAWLANSDRRLKKDIATIDGSTALEKISKMRGVTYLWNDDKTGTPRPTTTQYGFVAQELQEVFPENVSMDNQGYYQTAYGNYDALFVQAIKELEKQIENKDNKIADLESRLQRLEAMMSEK